MKQNICFIKEHVGSEFALLPFKTTSILMKKDLLKSQVQWINMILCTNSINSDLSPCTIVHSTNADYNFHCCMPFGSYCQVNDEPAPSNNTTKRTTGTITMNTRGNTQGGYNFMSLVTGKLLPKRHWIELPITDDVITHV